MSLPKKIEWTGNWLNFYKCHECSHKWQDVWDCQVDDSCPECQAKINSPYRSDEIYEGNYD